MRLAVSIAIILAVGALGIRLAGADPGTTGSQIVVNCTSPSLVAYGPASYAAASTWDSSPPRAGGCWEIRSSSATTTSTTTTTVAPTTTTTVPSTTTTTAPVTKYCRKHPRVKKCRR